MANTTNYNWETPDDTDLVKDGAAAIRTLGNSIDTTTKNLNPETTTGDIAYRSATANTNTRLPIGSTGQVLTVAAGVPSWATPTVGDITEVQAGTGISVASGGGPIPVITNTVATAFDAAGDLIYGTGADTFAKLSLGTAGKVLTVNSGATAPEWATPAGGKLAQVVSTTKTDTFSTNSATYTDVTGLSVTITPSSASSKIMVFVDVQVVGDNGTGNAFWQLVRTSTAIAIGDAAANRVQNTGMAYSADNNTAFSGSINFLDSPSTTSATTYKLQIRGAGGGTAYVNRSELDSNTSDYGRSASTITVMEILA